MAVPGQSYSISQVIERLRSGLPVQVIKSAFNPDGFPKFDDLTTLDQFKKSLEIKAKSINDRIAEIKAKKEAEEPATQNDA